MWLVIIFHFDLYVGYHGSFLTLEIFTSKVRVFPHSLFLESSAFSPLGWVHLCTINIFMIIVFLKPGTTLMD